jgi:hypothetical protein
MANLHEGSNDEQVPQCCLCSTRTGLGLLIVLNALVFVFRTVIAMNGLHWHMIGTFGLDLLWIVTGGFGVVKEKPNWILTFLVLLMLYQLLTLISMVARALGDSSFVYPFYPLLEGTGGSIGMVVGISIYMLLVNVWIGRATFRYYQYLRKKAEKQEMQL